jgi:hypothetical protein
MHASTLDHVCRDFRFCLPVEVYTWKAKYVEVGTVCAPRSYPEFYGCRPASLLSVPANHGVAGSQIIMFQNACTKKLHVFVKLTLHPKCVWREEPAAAVGSGR